ncbi:MAG: YceI family protein [Bacteroidota bacterium]
MKTLFFLFAISFTFSAIAQDQTAIINDRQTLSWIGKAAVGSYAPEGTLEIKSAEMFFSSESIATLNIVVDMPSLEQENRQLRDHLRDEDFFHVQAYPEARFTLNKPAKIEDGTAVLEGDMTIRGVTHPERITATISISDTGLALEFTHTMDRTRYGVNHNSPSIFKRLKENAIADDFILKGRLVFRNKNN